MWSIALLSMGLALVTPQGGGRGSATASPAEPVVLEISARAIQSNGEPSASASRSGANTFEGFLWSDSQCGLSAGDRDAPHAAAGWKFSANVIQQAGGAAIVRISWQRVWEQDKHVPASAASNSSGSVERMIRVGDRVQIDRVALGESSKCGSAVQLEATALRSTAGAGVAGLRPTLRGGRGMGLPQGQQAGQGQQGQQVQQGAQGQQGQQGGRGQQGQQGQGVQGGVRGGRGGLRPSNLVVTLFAAELWLVHTVPNRDATSTPESPVGMGRGGRASSTSGPTRPGSGRGSAAVPSEAGPGEHEEVTYQSIRFPAGGAGFALPPVTTTTAKGTYSVVVTGTLSARLDNGVPTTLVVTVNRQAMNPEQSSASSGGSSTKEIPWPKAGEVISFELPPAARGGQDPIAGEKLAIRMRLGGGTAGGRGGRPGG